MSIFSWVNFFVLGLSVTKINPMKIFRYMVVYAVDDIIKHFALLTAPTQVLVAPDNIELTSNQTVVLSCVAHAFPPPTISWSRNGRILPFSESLTNTRVENHGTVVGGVRLVRSRLEMCNAGALASGRYSCLADNGLTHSSADFQVTIPGTHCPSPPSPIPLYVSAVT